MAQNIFQIYLSKVEQDLPPFLQSANQQVKESFPDYKYSLLSNQSLELFVRENFDDEVFRAYRKLKPYAYKADLGRYCLAYARGGWYVDLGIKMMQIINGVNEGVEMIYFKDLGRGLSPGGLPYSVQVSLFYTKPSNPIFKKAIELVLENCKTENYGMGNLCPTGPGILGRAIASSGLSPEHITGHFMALTPQHSCKNRSYILPSGSILGFHKDTWIPDARPGDINCLGAIGTNNYVEMWENRNIYDSNITI